MYIVVHFLTHPYPTFGTFGIPYYWLDVSYLYNLYILLRLEKNMVIFFLFRIMITICIEYHSRIKKY